MKCLLCSLLEAQEQRLEAVEQRPARPGAVGNAYAVAAVKPGAAGFCAVDAGAGVESGCAIGAAAAPAGIRLPDVGRAARHRIGADMDSIATAAGENDRRPVGQVVF